MHPFPRLVSIVALLILALGLAACGGGGGSGGDAPAGPALPPQPGETLQVVRVHPAPEATDVVEETAIEIDFSAPLDPASIGLDPILVQDDMGTVAGTATYLPALNRIRFVPDAPLARGVTLHARTVPGLRDVDGNPRNDEFEWDFHTRLPELGPGPNPYSTDPERHYLRSFVLNEQGQGWVVWVQGESNGPNTLVAKRHGAGLGAGRYGLRQAVAISMAENGLVVNARGDAAVAYSEKVGGQRDAYVNRYDASTDAWSGPIPIETSTTHTVGNVRVALADSGDMIVSCTRTPTSSGDGRLWVRTYRDGLGWTTAQSPDAGVGSVGGTRPLLRANGDGLLAWNESVSGDRRVYARTWSPTAGFGSVETVAQGGALDYTLSACLIDPDGYAYLAYTRSSGSGQRAYVRQRIPEGEVGAGWQSARAMHPTDRDSVQSMEAVLAEDGAAHFAFKTRHDGLWTMMANHYRRGVGIGQPHLLPHQGLEAHGDQLALTAGPEGQVTVAYGAEMPGEDLQVLAASYRPGEGWLAPVVVFDIVSPDHFDALRLAARSSGAVYVLVEYEVDGGSGDDHLLGRWISPTGPLGLQDDVLVTPGERAIQVRLQIDGMGAGSVIWSGAKNGIPGSALFERRFE